MKAAAPATPWKPLPFLIALAVLVGCSREPAPSAPAADSPLAAALAEYERLAAQGSEKTAREITNLEYPMYRELMAVSGLEEDLGGGEQADEWLRLLFEEIELRTNALVGDLPKMIPVAYSGINIGNSGVGGSIQIGMVASGVISEGWGTLQDNGRTSGSETLSGERTSMDGSPWHDTGPTTVEWSETGFTYSTEMPIVEFEYVWREPGRGGKFHFDKETPKAEGKVATKVKVVTCPDTSGKIEAEFESNTELRSTSTAGTGAFIKVTGKVQRWLDDDANLLPDQIESEARVEQTTFDNFESAHVDVTLTLSTKTGKADIKVNERSRRATDDQVMNAAKLASMGRFAAMWALDQAKKAWESGHCVDIEVKTNPEKRTGADPGTNYKITAIPRAKSDGQVTTGTLRATLSGDSSLDPADTKVKVEADVKFDYANPKEKDKEASIAFEARSKRGVGRATAIFDTRKKGYVIGGCRLSGRVPDVDGPFNATVGGYNFRFAPTGDKAGTWNWSTSGARGEGPYHITLDEDGSTGTLTLPPGKTIAGSHTMATEAWTCTLTAEE